MSFPIGRVVEILLITVDHGDVGYTCWGYRLSHELTVPGPLHYNSSWVTPGDALNAAHKERNKLD
jgi:hypothetical protein